MKNLYKKIILLLFFSMMLVLLLRYPNMTIQYAKKGLSIWYKNMVPSLLPMMLVTSCMLKLNITSDFAAFLHPITKRCYHLSLNGTYALFMGLLCGFPMGAKIITELYQAKKISKSEANALLPICNNIGPVFMLTYALKNMVEHHIFLILILFYGIVLFYAFFLFHKKRFPTASKYSLEKKSFSVSLDEAISEGAASILSLGGYLIFFSILTIFPNELLHLPYKLTAILSCIIEITNGLSISYGLPFYIQLTLLQFGGICCCFQTIKYLVKTDLSFQYYIKHKLILSFLTFIIFFGIDSFFSFFFFA